MDNEKRKQYNLDIISRMKSGDLLQFNASKSWYPLRPCIKKDKELVKKLYGDRVKIVGEPEICELKVVKDNEREALVVECTE